MQRKISIGDRAGSERLLLKKLLGVLNSMQMSNYILMTFARGYIYRIVGKCDENHGLSLLITS